MDLLEHRKKSRARVGTYDPTELTASEREVFRLVGLGLTNKEIGSILFISPMTVRTHVKRVHCKTDIKGRAKLAVESFKLHWNTKNKFESAIELLKYRGGPGDNNEAIRILQEIGIREEEKSLGC